MKKQTNHKLAFSKTALAELNHEAMTAVAGGTSSTIFIVGGTVLTPVTLAGVYGVETNNLN